MVEREEAVDEPEREQRLALVARTVRDRDAVDGQSGLYIANSIPVVISAAAVKCLGGQLLGRLWPRDDRERQAAIDALRQMRSVATDPYSKGRNFVNHYAIPEWNIVPIAPTIAGMSPRYPICSLPASSTGAAARPAGACCPTPPIPA